MELGLYFAVCDPFELDASLAWASGLGIRAVELSSHVGGRFDVDEMFEPGRARTLRDVISRHGLRISALNMSADGQLLLGPYHSDTDWICGGTAQDKQSSLLEGCVGRRTWPPSSTFQS